MLRHKWGNHDISWRVDPDRIFVGLSLSSEYAGAVHISFDHFGSGGSDDIWFEKGVGIVGEHYFHNGSYEEYTRKLRPPLP